LKNKYILNNLSDETIVNVYLKTLDASLFKLLYDRYQRFVFAKCLSFSKNKCEAEDISQDIFLKLLLKLSTFNGRSKFSTWLYAFTYNHCVNYYNRNRYRRLKDESFNIDKLIDKSNLPSAQDTVYKFQQFEKLNTAMKLISHGDKELLLLKYQNYKTIKELGGIYNIGESAVKMRLKRAKSKLLGVYNTLSTKAIQ
jgi:RNA polymerase sigma-70 factor (ECF subfamily)